MKFLILTKIFVGSLVILLVLNVFLQVTSLLFVKNSEPEISTIDTKPFFDENLFFSGIEKAKDISVYKDSITQAFILPHHLIASELIADSFKSLRERPPKTLFIIGPNHNNLGGANIITAYASWKTVFGKVETDKSLVRKLVETNLLKEDPKVISQEHSVSTLIPYIKYYLPTTYVIPIILKRSTTLEELTALAEIIGKYEAPYYLFAFSIDFSHTLDRDGAEKKDNLTISYMKERNFGVIKKLDEKFTDSPPSLILFLKLNELATDKNLNILYTTNSSEFNSDPHKEVTSYFAVSY